MKERKLPADGIVSHRVRRRSAASPQDTDATALGTSSWRRTSLCTGTWALPVSRGARHRSDTPSEESKIRSGGIRTLRVLPKA
eukprot:scaffold1178_cov252-Pinguiococcus_pyrenoidosus.AAC.32